MKELFREVENAIETAIKNKHRFLVFLCSSSLKGALKVCEKIIERSKEKTGKSDLLIVGRENFLEIAKHFEGVLIHWKDSAQVLGRTFSSLIMDFSEGFHPNDLGIVVETVEEGGAIVAISPPLE
ncbi:MAG: tRNA(Met) cytidine acetyltransferase TmcA domain-containing protein, partial [Archaeoglobaceae archaeon]